MTKRNRKYTSVRSREKKEQLKTRHQIAPEGKVIIPKHKRKTRSAERQQWIKEYADLRV